VKERALSPLLKGEILMTYLRIYYIKNTKGEVIYTNTNPNEFGKYVHDYLKLNFKQYPTYQLIKENVTDFKIGYKELEIEF